MTPIESTALVVRVLRAEELMDTGVRLEVAFGPVHLVIVLDRVGGHVFENPVRYACPGVIREDVIVKGTDVGHTRESVFHDLRDPGWGRHCMVTREGWCCGRDSTEDGKARFESREGLKEMRGQYRFNYDFKGFSREIFLHQRGLHCSFDVLAACP